MDRREWIQRASLYLGAFVAGGVVQGCGRAPKRARLTPRTAGARKPPAAQTDLAVAEGTDYPKALEAAVGEFGGIEAFVRKGDRVLLSPNLAFARTPEQAANTHPEILRAMIDLCKGAGASQIVVLDYTLDSPTLAFAQNGAEEAVAGTGATLGSPDREFMYQEMDFSGTVAHPKHRIRTKIAKKVLSADVYISMPVAKDHEAAVISMSLKKQMGVIWDRRVYHRTDLHQCIADLAAVLQPHLIVLDATRALQTRGPKGPGEVTTPNQIVVGTNMVAVDAYGCRYLTVKQVKPADVRHLQLAHEMGLGPMDPTQLRVKELVM